jgi:hypothetical protein
VTAKRVVDYYAANFRAMFVGTEAEPHRLVLARGGHPRGFKYDEGHCSGCGSGAALFAPTPDQLGTI